MLQLDFNVYSLEKKNEKLEYMHANPVNLGLVRHPQDWPWSSWAFYSRSESGLIAMDRESVDSEGEEKAPPATAGKPTKNESGAPYGTHSLTGLAC
jgi:hypothetical protein